MTGYAKLTAWSTPMDAGAGAAPNDTGNWVAARLAVYVGGGIGISNNVQNGGAELTTSPEHGIDNKGVNDILVVDFGSTGWDVNSFALGWTANAQTGAAGGTVAVEAWVGDTFGTESFIGTNNNINQTPVGGYTRLNLSPDPVGANTLINDCVAAAAPCNTTGRYLVITGALGAGIGGATGYNDAFKLKEIVATKTGGNQGQGVPSPGSLPLIALGLLALTLARRRLVANA